MDKKELINLMNAYQNEKNPQKKELNKTSLFDAYKEWCGISESWFMSESDGNIIKLIADDINYKF